jgi:RNA polymerase sigma-70 factor, ECF subfamily
MTTTAGLSHLTDFEAHRRTLTGLAYRMLGSRAEAEDVVQDAYLRWHAVDLAAIGEPRRYLATVVTRLCLDRLKSARARREFYVGQWLPEPVVDETFDDEPAGDLARDITVALMLVLERLSPLERASFLLHDVFGLDFAEVSRALGRSEAACRQLGARAREHIAAGRPRFPASSEDGYRLASAFHQAAISGDAQALAQTLAHDVVLYSDGGGKRIAAFNPIHGREKVLRFLDGVSRKNASLATLKVRDATINGLPGFVLRDEDGAIETAAFESRDGRITAIYIMRNPHKLRHVRF